jgi:hypothetical protein
MIEHNVGVRLQALDEDFFAEDETAAATLASAIARWTRSERATEIAKLLFPINLIVGSLRHRDTPDLSLA